MVRADNEAADKLSKLGSTWAVIPYGVFIHDLVKPSVKEEEKPVGEQPSTDQLVVVIPTTGTDRRESHSLGISPLRRFPRTRPRWNAS
jgi:hypothetical protein